VQSHWRKAQGSDLPDVMAIAAAVHPDLPERTAVIAEKMRLYADGCRVLVSDGASVGYGLAHPWTLHQIPPLDEFLGALPAAPDCLYIHDVAVLPAFRGGAAAAYVEAIMALARSARLAHLALVSVHDTAPFWTRFGFRAVAPNPALAMKLRSYGQAAAYMIATLV
jgi:ribosomal protein S18 acetylase RimI-like enzyme